MTMMNMNMNRHARKAILASLVASQMITPAEARSAIVYVPSAPAIIRPASLWVPYEKKLIKKEHPLLGGPVPIGVFAVAGSGGGTSLVNGYRNSYVDATTQTNYSFATCDLGTPHATRMVVVVARASDIAISACTVDGTAATSVIAVTNAGRRISMWRAASTANATGTIALTNAPAINGTIHVFAIYPASQTPTGTTSVHGGTSPQTALNLVKTDAGFTIIGVTATGGAAGAVTQTGAETIIEDYDAEVEAGARTMAGHHVNTATTSTDDYTATFVGASGVGLVVASWL